MKQLMLGNKALARGLYEAGCSVVSSYPGTPSTEVTEEAAKYDEIYCEWAPNEKVAMEVAFGASLAGKRSFCGMKHVGLNVAADPLFTCSYTGVNGGMVICVADDPGMHSSQNEQDSRHHAIASKIPMLEPSDSTEAYEFAKKAFELSEEFDTPVIIKMCTRVAHSQSIVEPGERVVPETIPYEKNIAKYVMMPGNAIRRHPVVEERTRKLIEYGNHCDFNRVEMGDTKLGIITSSTCYQYAKEVFGDKASILKIGLVNPLPDQLILDFAAKVEKLAIIEELDPILENHCKELGLTVTGKDALPMEGEFSQNLIAEKLGIEVPAHKELGEALPGRPPVMCAGCPHRGLFFTLSKNKCTVLGDIGCYTLGNAMPLDMVDTCLCMGAGLGIAQGVYHTEPDTTCFAFVGDSTFFASAIPGVVNAVYNQADMTLIVLDNSTTAMTGHQPHPGTGHTMMGDIVNKIDIVGILKGIGLKTVETINPFEHEAAVQTVARVAAEPGVKAIIFKSPCIAITKSSRCMHIDTDACIGCQKCIREIGCPALYTFEGKVCIDESLCTGCTLCSQLCPVHAIGDGQEERGQA